MKLKPFFISLLILLSPSLFANSAQPGFWNAGGAGTFSLLFPEDSTGYKKIQMVRELVSIQLYKGYAVVKGTYWMYNTTDSLISIKAGYPLNSSFEGKSDDYRKAEIKFESLYGIEVYSNNLKQTLLAETETSSYPNWYVWQNAFAPQDTTKITVYFIVNTNNTFIRSGYAGDENNGFIYLLETGSTWKQPIVTGEIRMELKDGISIQGIQGIKPDSVFRINEEKAQLLYRFSNLSPTPEHNIILKYTENLKRFDFNEVLKNQTQLYIEIDRFSTSTIDFKTFESYTFGDPFEVNSINWTGIVFFVVIVGVPVICIALSILCIVLFIRFMRR